MPYKKLLVFVVLLFILGLGVYLYKKSQPKPNITEGRVYTNEKTTEAEGTLVGEFPKFPIYPGMRTDKTFRKEQGEKTDFVGAWYFEGGDNKVPVIMKWYVDELKKAGWKVEGPFIDEGQGEVHINAENTNHTARVMSSERYDEDPGGPGDIILVEILEK